MNAALRADPAAMRVNLTVPSTAVRLGPFAFDGLKALLGVDLAEVLSSLMIGPKSQRPVLGGFVDVYPLAIPDGEGLAGPRASRIRLAPDTSPGVRLRWVTDRDEKMRALHASMALHLPPLLRAPLRVQRLTAGVVRADRAALGPRAILARLVRGDQAAVLAARREERGSPPDYRWLAGLVLRLGQYVGQQQRNRRHLTTTGSDPSWWATAAKDIRGWLGHPELADRGAGEPTWVLSRDVHGAAIMRALREEDTLPLVAGLAGTSAAALRLARAPVEDDTRLYELWVVLSVTEVLRQNFGFRFRDGEPQRFRDYVDYDGNLRLKPMALQRKCPDLRGNPVDVDIDIEHERAFGALRPDLTMTVRAGHRRSVHLLDAKWSWAVKDHVQRTARGYFRRLRAADPDIVSSFVCLPTPTASESLRPRASVPSKPTTTHSMVGRTHVTTWRNHSASGSG